MDGDNYSSFQQKKNCHIDSCDITFNCSDPLSDEYPDKDKYQNNQSKKCLSSIIYNQAKVSQCEAELFCAVTRRLCYELRKASNLIDLSKVMYMINCFLTASASKEKSIAEVVTSCKPQDKCNDKCDDCC